MKKIPMRMCVVTKEKWPKSELIRVVVSNDEIIVDETGKVNGHGCYLKKDIDVINKARDKKVLDNCLGISVPLSVYDNIIDKIN